MEKFILGTVLGKRFSWVGSLNEFTNLYKLGYFSFQHLVTLVVVVWKYSAVRIWLQFLKKILIK